MGSVIENQKTKEKCQIFTPDNIVKKMLEYLGYHENLYGKAILENSCGDGQFLKEILKIYIEDCNRQQIIKPDIKRGLERDIWGVELDRDLYVSCIQNLNAIVNEYGIQEIKWNIFNRDAIRFPVEREFDFVIGNPPYVSYWDLDKSEREFIEKHYTACQFGAWDYSYAFLQEGLIRLSSCGKLVFIVPNSIFKTKSGAEIRRLIKPVITEIYDYTTTKIFKQVLTSPAIIVLERGSNNNEIEYHNLSEKKMLKVSKELLGNCWAFKNDDFSHPCDNRFGDYFNVAIGVATQLNKAFVLTDWEIHDNYIQKNNIQIELLAVRKAASPKNKKRNVIDFIIFPYYYEDGILCRYSENEFKNKFPKAYAYLEIHKEDLKKRDADKQAQWFEYGRSQALTHINQPKLLISTVITGSVLVYELEENEIPYSGLYITATGNLPLSKAKEILESKEFKQYIKPVGINANGKSIRIVAKNVCDYQW